MRVFGMTRGAAHVVVAHHFWNRAGGMQFLCAAVASAFDTLGFIPVLASPVRIDVSRYSEWFGFDLSHYPRVDYPLSIRALGLYLRLLVWLPVRKAVNAFGARMVFIDEPFYAPVLRWLRERGVKLIEYIHFPVEAVGDERLRGTGLHYREDPYLVERYGRFPLSVYLRFFLVLGRLFARRNPFESADLVLVNSRWTGRIVEMLYGGKPIVLNPPLSPKTSIVKEPKPFEERSLTVAMLGRFSEEKRYHWVVSKVAPLLLREVPGSKLIIMGATGTRHSEGYYRLVWKLASRAGLRVSDSLDRDADVYLLANAPRGQVNAVLDSARAFLHATINEHWGIAVAEALARGIPPVVHKSGGAWTDIVEEGRYGLGYNNEYEAAEALARLLTDPRLFASKLSGRLEKLESLRFESFVSKLGRLVERLGF